MATSSAEGVTCTPMSLVGVAMKGPGDVLIEVLAHPRRTAGVWAVWMTGWALVGWFSRRVLAPAVDRECDVDH